MSDAALPDGCTLRRPTIEDIPALVELQNAVFLAEIGRTDTDEDEARREWSSPDLHLAEDAWVVETPEKSLIACVSVSDEGDAAAEMDGYVHPDREGEGLGTLMLGLAETRAREKLSRASVGEPRLLRQALWVSGSQARAFFETNGFRSVRHFLRMTIDLDTSINPAPLAPPLEVRLFEPGDERSVWAASEDAFQDHWDYHPMSYETWHARRISTDASHDPSLWFLAVDGSEIVGSSICRGPSALNPDGGWVADLSVRRPWRRQGVGLALLTRSFSEMQRRRFSSAGLNVDAQSLTGALRLYERAGMREAETIVFLEKRLASA